MGVEKEITNELTFYTKKIALFEILPVHELLLLIYLNFTKLVWKHLIFFELVIFSYFYKQTIFANTFQNEWYLLNFIAANCHKVSDWEYMQEYLNVYLRLAEFIKKKTTLKLI